MMKKKNTFTDFIAAAEHLIAGGWTSADRLVIEGGSAGGLLMGAVVNLRPGLFRAVVSKVPFVDVINSMLDETLPLTVGEFEEWGNPKKEDEYEYMKGYCPYTNLQRQPYPAMLVKTSFHDSQVMYWEPAKYVAKLRTLKTDKNPLLLKTNMAAGHGGASGRYDALRESGAGLRVHPGAGRAGSLKMRTLASHVGGRWVEPEGDAGDARESRDRGAARPRGGGGDRPQGGAGVRARHGRTRAPARADLRGAGGAPAGRVRRLDRPPQRAARPVGHERRQHAQRRQVRRGRRHLHSLRLRGDRPATGSGEACLADGEGITLGRSPRFHGQHIAVPRQGVAVHINAFNFPAWGLAEKAAVALLAGMPVLDQARHQLLPARPPHGGDPGREGGAAPRRALPARRRCRRPPRAPRPAGRGGLHGLG